jgi:peptide deformylase
MILKYPHPLLKEKSKLILYWDDSSKEILKIFKSELNKIKEKCLGLAACQIGLPYSIIWIRDFGYMINPKIIEQSKEKTGSAESCLSVPDQVYGVERFKSVTVLYRDEKYHICRQKFSDQFAIVVQHEIDHTLGILICEHPYLVYGNKKGNEV